MIHCRSPPPRIAALRPITKLSAESILRILIANFGCPTNRRIDSSGERAIRNKKSKRKAPRVDRRGYGRTREAQEGRVVEETKYRNAHLWRVLEAEREGKNLTNSQRALSEIKTRAARLPRSARALGYLSAAPVPLCPLLSIRTVAPASACNFSPRRLFLRAATVGAAFSLPSASPCRSFFDLALLRFSVRSYPSPLSPPSPSAQIRRATRPLRKLLASLFRSLIYLSTRFSSFFFSREDKTREGTNKGSERAKASISRYRYLRRRVRVAVEEG